MDAVVDYEEELSQQLQQQQVALAEIQEALLEEASDELQEVKQQLEEAIQELESALLGLKKERLLALLDGNNHHQGEAVAAAASAAHLQRPAQLAVGSACRFRFDDGRWYAGHIVSYAADGQAQVSFATPTRAFMLEDATLPVGRLRPSRPSPCIPAQHMSAYARPQALVPSGETGGQSTGAGGQAGASGSGRLWHSVLVRSVDELRGTAVVKTQDGSTAALSFEDLVEKAWITDSDLDHSDEDYDNGGGGGGARHRGSKGWGGADAAGDGSDSGSSCGIDEEELEEELEEEDEEVHGGLGLDVFAHARLAARAGPQTDTAHFAEWEQHSRGIASKLLAKMGYVRGQGLGRSGVPTPLEVQLLPQRQGLGGGKPRVTDDAGADGKAKRSKKRGGERTRRKKHAEQARQHREARLDDEAKAEREQGPGAVGLFSFINTQLGDQSEAAAKIKAVETAMLKGVVPQPGQGRFGASAQATKSKAAKEVDRGSLMAQSNRVSAAQAKVDHFAAMLKRNSSNKELAAQIRANLVQAQAQAKQAQTDLSRMQQSVSGKESQAKFWGKF